MTAKAFILIETVLGRSKEVAIALKKIDGVKTVDTVTGPYDVIAEIEGEHQNDIGNSVFKIYRIAGITRTVTCLVMEERQ